ncbi:hypothetical protein [Streptomyces sp. NPDC088254]
MRCRLGRWRGQQPVTDEFQGQGLVEPPTQGKPEVTAIDYRMVDSR